jgi:hypothetical protein
MDDNTNNTPQETPEEAAKSFGDEWQQIPSASAEEWSKEIPAVPVPRKSRQSPTAGRPAASRC